MCGCVVLCFVCLFIYLFLFCFLFLFCSVLFCYLHDRVKSLKVIGCV